MKRRTYMRPTMMAEEFIAQEFCAVCDTITRVEVETLSAGNGWFAPDQNGNGRFDEADKKGGYPKHFNPQGGTLIMDGNQYEDYLEKRDTGFYWDDYQNAPSSYYAVYGYIPGGGNAGNGAWAIETKTIHHIYKNQS